MKAIMYHYIRPEARGFPHLRYLHINNFIRQLEYFSDTYGFISKQDFFESILTGKPLKGVILTFDDGLKDHYLYVLPELLKRDLWGIFYVISCPFLTRKFAEVHRIHMLLGKYGGNFVKNAIKDIISENMLSHAHIKEFQTETYRCQNNDESTNYVKRVLNYYIDYKYRPIVINELMSKYFPNEDGLLDKFYMTKDELALMHCSGMILGNHTVNHSVMSKLSNEEQEMEIVLSAQMLESITGKSGVKTFCYPYGGFHTFTDQTEQILENNNILFSFNVENRDINNKDLLLYKHALPRYDCNVFPYGSC